MLPYMGYWWLSAWLQYLHYYGDTTSKKPLIWNWFSVDRCASRTLLKQGVYGGKPVIRRTLVLTPGSLVKVCDVLVITLQPTIFNGSCSYLAQPFTLVGAWTLLIIGFVCSFSGILWHFEILWIHWLTCFLDNRVRTDLEKCLNFSGVLKKCLIFNFALKMVIFPGKVLANDKFILEK